VSFNLVLKLRDASGARALVQAVSTPGSASFRHYLTAAQWEARFSPTAEQLAQAESWLKSEGFTVGAVSKDRLTIAASGTAAQVQSAFGTTLANYRVAGHTVRQAKTNMSVPTSIAGIVAGAMGVNQEPARPAVKAADPDLPGSSKVSSTPAATPGQFPPPPPAFITSPPCGAYYNAGSTTLNPPFGNGYPATVPDIVCGYKPPQLRSAYGVTPAATGKGTTIAIVDAYGSGTIRADARRYFSMNDASNPFSKAHFSQILATPFDQEDVCDASGWATEQAIDVESSHGMAPDANILYVGAQDCFDDALLAADQTVIDNGLANVITNSWGDLGGDLLADAATRAAFDDEFLLADATGITVLFSSGDDGDDFAELGFSSADYPASSPLVTAVGGTSLKIDANGNRTGELGWATGRSFLCTRNLVNVLCDASQLNTWTPASLDGASGGYTSYTYLQPFYQAPVVPTALSERNSPIFGPVPFRVVPDISLDADPGTGFLIGYTETFPGGAQKYGQTRYGGTSLASPILSGVVADADQAAGVPVGFINPDIYRMAGNAAAVTDILPTGKQGNYRVDYANQLFPGVEDKAISFRELYFSGQETFCDATGNCASRTFPMTVTKGYDSLTGLGGIGPDFIADLANF
jgi:subtilase family serine protease